MKDSQVLRMPDGRALGWAEQGDPQGRPVLSISGGATGRLQRHPVEDELVQAGVRQITYDRPGYGLSDALPGRAVADAAVDVEALLDALDLERVGVIGRSAGAPHALAVAALLPERCTVIHALACVAPPGAPGLDYFNGMDPRNISRFEIAARGRDEAYPTLSAEAQGMVERARRDPTTILGLEHVPESDLAVFRESGRHTAQAIVDACRPGPWGFIDDLVAITTPWGFDPAATVAPVVFEYGMQDAGVPVHHGEWYASHVPHKEVRANQHGGHLSTNAESLARIIEVSSA